MPQMQQQKRLAAQSAQTLSRIACLEQQHGKAPQRCKVMSLMHTYRVLEQPKMILASAVQPSELLPDKRLSQ